MKGKKMNLTIDNPSCVAHDGVQANGQVLQKMKKIAAKRKMAARHHVMLGLLD